MIKWIVSGVVGLLFMGGGFFFGLRLAPMPAPKKAVAAASAPAPAAVPEAIGLETLRKTTEGMMDINQALQEREREVAAREKRVQDEEEELTAERSALDRSHDKFKELYAQFQQRLELVDAAEADQLQRQVVIYNSMDPAQSVDLLRALDDSTVVRLFSIMDVKPLAKLVSAWKTKYPADAPRILEALNSMGRVQPADKMTMPDGTASSDSAPASSPAPAADAAPSTPDNSTPPANADNSSSAPDAPAATSAPATTSDNSSATPAGAPSAGDALTPPADAPAASTPASPDASAPASTDASAPADTQSAATTPPANDSPDGVATAKNN